MRVFISSAHNKPSGGTAVLNQIVNLFQEKGYEAFLVIPDKTEKATFIEKSAPICNFDDVKLWCREDDVIIDCWQSRVSFETTKSVPAKTKIFWQHGASIPVGKRVVDEAVYTAGNPYTQFWNVSKACAHYIQEKYDLPLVSIVHPFFDTNAIKKFQDKKNTYEREGILLLNRRGKKYIRAIQEHFGDTEKITVLDEPFHQEEFFAMLVRHRFFVTVDPGVNNGSSIKKKAKNYIKCVIDKDFRRKYGNRTKWIIPEGHLLGFPMPPVEAALLGCTVIGFAMGGGLEWMTSKNCFLAKDRDKKDLLKQISLGFESDEEKLRNMREKSFQDVSQFTKEHTWKQLSSLLHI